MNGLLILSLCAAATGDDAFARFERWSKELQAAQSEQRRAELRPEGLRLAVERKNAMLELIRKDPATALEKAITADGLPQEVALEIEVPISGIARYEVLGYMTHPGGYAELVQVPLQNVLPIPDSIDFVQAAAFPLTFLTAWHMLITRARLQRGEDVLVIAAGSGVGQAAVQIAALFGARVFATAGADDKLQRAQALGASAVIHHHKQDIADEIRRLTNKRGVDVVIEHVGEATWPKSVRAMARGGRLVTCGATTGYNGAIDLRALFAKQLTLMGSYMGTKGELMRVATFFFRGELKPIVDRTYPLAEAAAAQQRMEESGQFGKIVLEVP